jgi:hypothetical protein
MGFTIVAVVAGLVLGLASGGRPRNATSRPVRGIVVLAAAVALQALPPALDLGDTVGLACVLGSYALLLAFTLANVRLVGMPVVLVGLLLNVVVITANAGMPVRAEAILAVEHHRTPAEVAGLTFGAKRHLETPEDRLTFLGDIVPVRPFHQVVSFGDLVLALGMADVVFRLLKPRNRHAVHQPRSTRRPVAAGVE